MIAAQSQAAQARANAEMERARQHAVAQGLKDGTLRYSPTQKRTIAQNNAKRTWLLSQQGRMPEQQRLRELAECDQVDRNNSPMPVPPDEQPPDIAELVNKRTFVHPEYGLMTVNKDGMPQVVRGADPSLKYKMEEQQQRIERSKHDAQKADEEHFLRNFYRPELNRKRAESGTSLNGPSLYWQDDKGNIDYEGAMNRAREQFAMFKASQNPEMQGTMDQYNRFLNARFGRFDQTQLGDLSAMNPNDVHLKNELQRRNNPKQKFYGFAPESQDWRQALDTLQGMPSIAMQQEQAAKPDNSGVLQQFTQHAVGERPLSPDQFQQRYPGQNYQHYLGARDLAAKMAGQPQTRAMPSGQQVPAGGQITIPYNYNGPANPEVEAMAPGTQMATRAGLRVIKEPAPDSQVPPPPEPMIPKDDPAAGQPKVMGPMPMPRGLGQEQAVEWLKSLPSDATSVLLPDGKIIRRKPQQDDEAMTGD